ncbi:MAG: bifunctional UDP-2,4-diacetamido-2,4,6-trideoxy-beta-L-altropyranose hydrolase/GNAT family N-acetyltransferase [Coriobacteriia bacterium]|nr:bifunctional UDP-2,4-diacetamido-2,4,6-trideoxy-beta-L-altropyranose hydrolase/GNAT family N-acetyltransferase [Coriobacteriia bacterium]
MSSESPGTLLLCVDADKAVGAGHAVRSLALAQAWQRAGGRAVFVGNMALPWFCEELAARGIDLVGTVGQEQITDNELVLIAKRYNAEWLSFDGYHYPTELVLQLQQHGLQVLAFDDGGGSFPVTADIVLNQNFGAEEEDYEGAEGICLLGAQYALLREEVLCLRAERQRRQPSSDECLLITMGGGEQTSRFLELAGLLGDLKEKENSFFSTIVIAPGESDQRAIAEAFKHQGLSMRILDDPRMLIAQYLKTSAALTAAGSTCWELNYLGIPFRLLVVADNQKPIADELTERGISKLVSFESLAELLASESPAVSERVIDGGGAVRVVNEMLRLTAIKQSAIIVTSEALPSSARLSFREIAPPDTDLLVSWRSSERVRAYSRNDRPVTTVEHEAWFRRYQTDPSELRLLFFEKASGEPLGLVGAQREGDTARLSYYLGEAAFEGKGFMTEALSQFINWLFSQGTIRRVSALVRVDNKASQAVLHRLGFFYDETEEGSGKMWLLAIREREKKENKES